MRFLRIALCAAALAPVVAAGEPPSRAGRPIAFVHANVVPMDADRVLRDQTVVVSGGRIAAVGPTGKTPVPPGARVIDAAGRGTFPRASPTCTFTSTRRRS